MKPSISVVIPTFLEHETIAETIASLQVHADDAQALEVIVVDGSPDDRTRKAIKDKKVRVLQSKGGTRASSMNTGASEAKNDVLLFLHSDTILPQSWDRLIRDAAQKGFAGGGFYKKFDNPAFLLKLNAWYSNVRARLRKDMLGDNAIWITKKMFKKLKGYKQMALMEDLDLSKRMKKYPLKIFRQRIVTSARRFEKFGIFKTLCLMLKLRIQYALGKDPSILKRSYSDDK